MVDESKVSLEKEKEKERIKKMATDPTAFLQFKGVDMKKIDYCGKLIMCSNFVDNFIKINGDDVRFWVVKVGVIQDKIVGFKRKLFAEIPYFLHYIATRDIIHEESAERHWFSNDLLNTEARQNIIEKTKPPFEIILDDYFTEIAGNLVLNNMADEFKICINDVIAENKAHTKYLGPTNITDYLSKKAIKPTGKTERYDLYSYQNNTNNIFKKIGKPYKLFCADFLPKADIQDNQKPAKTEDIKCPF